MEAFGFGGKSKLKHLEFVKILAAGCVVVLSWLYGYGKEIIKAVIRTAYEKTKGLADHALSFLDDKVDERGSPSFKKLLDRVDQLVNIASDAAQVLALEINLIGPHNAMSIIVSFINNLFADLLPTLVSKLNRVPFLGAIAGLTLPFFAFCSDMFSNSINKLATGGSSILTKLPNVPIPDLTKLIKQVGDAPVRIGGNIIEDLAKPLKQVGLAPTQQENDMNIVDNLSKAFKQVGVAPPEKSDHKEIIGDLTKAVKQVGLAPEEKDEGNIIEGLTNVFKQVVVAPVEKGSGDIIGELAKGFKQVGIAPVDRDEGSISKDLSKALKQVGITPA